MTKAEQVEKELAKLLEERAAASASLSTQSRTVALSILAMIWLLLSGAQGGLQAKFADSTNALLTIGLLAVLALLCDFIQYAFALWETDRAYDQSENATDPDDVGYPDNSALRKMQNAGFCAKLVFTVAASLWLVGLMASKIVSEDARGLEAASKSASVTCTDQSKCTIVDGSNSN